MLNLHQAARGFRIYTEEGGDKKDPWCWELRSRTACLYPKTENAFCVLWTGKGSKALKRLAERVHSLDGEVLYYFANSALESVLSNVKFSKKRQITDEMRERGRKLAATYGFKS